MINVVVHGRVLRALLDTGSPRTTLFLGASHRIGLHATDLAPDPRLTLGGSGPHSERAWLHWLDAIAIGRLTFANAKIFVVDGAIDGGIDMLLGTDFLTHVHAWLSLSSHRLVMQVPAPSFGRH